MSYTQMIRNFLLDRKGGFFDIIKESKKFKFIPINKLFLLCQIYDVCSEDVLSIK